MLRVSSSKELSPEMGSGDGKGSGIAVMSSVFLTVVVVDSVPA